MERNASFARLNRIVYRLATICEVCCWLGVAVSAVIGAPFIMANGIMASVAIIPALLMTAAWVTSLILLARVFGGVGTIGSRIQRWLDHDAEDGIFAADLAGPLRDIGRWLIDIAVLDVAGRALSLILIALMPWMKSDARFDFDIGGGGLMTVAGFGMLGALSHMLARVFDYGAEHTKSSSPSS